MRILFVGPPLYGLLYPVLSLAQAFRVNGHEVLIASGGQFAQKAAEAGLVVFDAAPGLDSEAGYRHHEAQRKKSNIGTQMGNFSFFSEEMADHLVEFAGHWRPDLIIYPPLGVIGPLIAAKYDIPVVMQTVGFGHTLAYQGCNAFAHGRLSSPQCRGHTTRYGLDRRNTAEYEHSGKRR